MQAGLAMRRETATVSFPLFAWRMTACHVVTYFVAGLLAYTLLDYKEAFTNGPLAGLMKPLESPVYAAGPMLQVFRGVLFALILYPFRETILDTPRGWLKLWGLFAGLAILGTAGPAPASLEGLFYTKLTVLDHLKGLPETMLQTLVLSVLLVAWCRKPSKQWNVRMGILCGLIFLMSTAGLFARRPEMFR